MVGRSILNRTQRPSRTGPTRLLYDLAPNTEAIRLRDIFSRGVPETVYRLQAPANRSSNLPHNDFVPTLLPSTDTTVRQGFQLEPASALTLCVTTVRSVSCHYWILALEGSKHDKTTRCPAFCTSFCGHPTHLLQNNKVNELNERRCGIKKRGNTMFATASVLQCANHISKQHAGVQPMLKR